MPFTAYMPCTCRCMAFFFLRNVSNPAFSFSSSVLHSYLCALRFTSALFHVYASYCYPCCFVISPIKPRCQPRFAALHAKRFIRAHFGNISLSSLSFHLYGTSLLTAFHLAMRHFPFHFIGAFRWSFCGIFITFLRCTIMAHYFGAFSLHNYGTLFFFYILFRFLLFWRYAFTPMNDAVVVQCFVPALFCNALRIFAIPRRDAPSWLIVLRIRYTV